jgi:hypothetical protein
MTFENMTHDQIRKVEAIFRIRRLKLGDKIDQRNLDDIKLLMGENPEPEIFMSMNLHGDGTVEVTKGAELLEGSDKPDGVENN